MVLNYIEKAFEIYKKNFSNLVLMQFVILVISGIVFLIGFLPLLILYFTTRGTPFFQILFSPFGIATLSFSVIIFAIGMLVSWVLEGGYTRVIYESLKGKVRWETLWKTVRTKYKTFIGARFIVLVVLGIILSIFILPFILSFVTLKTTTIRPLFLASSILMLLVGVLITFLVGILFILKYQAIVIDNLGAIDAIKRSISIAKKNYFQLLLLAIVIAIINGVASLIPYVGAVIAAVFVSPLVMITYTLFYLEKRRR